MNWERDPLWQARHALVALALVVLLSIFVAALLGRWIGELLGGDYELNALIYFCFLAYVVSGAILLFARVLQYDSRPLTVARFLLCLAGVWLWPAVLAAQPKKKSVSREGDD